MRCLFIWVLDKGQRLILQHDVHELLYLQLWLVELQLRASVLSDERLSQCIFLATECSFRTKNRRDILRRFTSEAASIAGYKNAR